MEVIFDTFSGNNIEVSREMKGQSKKRKKSEQLEGQQKIGDKTVETKAETQDKVYANTSEENTKPSNECSSTSQLQTAVKNASSDIMKMNKELAYAREHPYFARDRLMTRAEEKLYRLMLKSINSRLKCINKSVVIFPKIRLADIIDTHRSLDKSYLYKIAYKHIDYTICDSESLDVITTVELDDDYHNMDSKIARDKFVDETLRYCGVQLFRVGQAIDTVTDSTISNIVDYVISSYCPVCPVCQGIMEFKKSGRRSNYGHRFFGCKNWKPNGEGCNCSIDID